MNALAEKTVGYLSGVMYCLLTALSAIYIADVNTEVPPALSILTTFLFSMLWFHLINIRRVHTLYQTCWKAKKSWLILNVSTMLSWLGAFVALQYLTPVLYIAVFMALIPIITYFVCVYRGRESFAMKHVWFGLVIIILVVLLTGETFLQAGHVPVEYLWKGFIFMLVSAIGGAWYLVDAKTMQDECKLTSAQMLAVRFYGLLIIAFFWALFTQALPSVPALPFLKLIGLALVVSVLPLYCLQLSLHRIGAVSFSFLMPFTPVFTYVLYLVNGGHSSVPIFATVFALTVVLIAYSAARYKQKR